MVFFYPLRVIFYKKTPRENTDSKKTCCLEVTFFYFDHLLYKVFYNGGSKDR